MSDIFDCVRELNNGTLLLRMALALLFGGLIGYNRERKKMPAGIRTYMLVCLGACLTAVLAVYNTNNLALVLGDTVRTDIGRFSAQVINGIGFLGAGTIILTEEGVRGVTTAACLWSAGCMGITIGFGFYECAIAGFIVIILLIYVLPIIQRKLRSISEAKTTVEKGQDFEANMTSGGGKHSV